MFNNDNITIENGHLIVGGCDCVELAKKYSTPLYVLDETTGETVRTFETNEEMYVVYLSNSENVELLNNNLVKQYRSGLNNYEEAIKEGEDTVIIRHDLK